MPRFDRYIVSQLVMVFGFFALVLVGVYWINRAVGLFDQLIGDGQTALAFLKFSVLTLPNVIRLLLPVAAFIATIYAINRLMSESELVVMQATGFSPFRLARPVAVFGLFVVVMVLILANFLVPMARGAADKQRSEMSENITAHFLQDGQFTHPSAGVTLYVRDLSSKGELLDLFLSDDRNPQRHMTYTASRSLFLHGDSGPKLLMFNGMFQEMDAKGQGLSVTRFDDFTYDLGALLSKSGPGRRSAEALPTRDLLWPTQALSDETGDTRTALTYAGHARLGEPWLALAAVLLGVASLMQGDYSRMGLWRQIMVAVVLLVGLQAITTFAAARGAKLQLGYLLAYVAPVIGIAVALAMLWWAGRPRAQAGAAADAKGAAL